jgi:hypothetical protein
MINLLQNFHKISYYFKYINLKIMLKSKQSSADQNKSLQKSLQKSQSSASLKRKSSTSLPKAQSKRKDQNYQINI